MMNILAAFLPCLVSIAHAAAAQAVAEPSVQVQTAALQRQLLAETRVGYGRVSPNTGSTININLPRPGQVTRLLVTPGEVVKGGAPLLEFDTGAAAALAWRQAENALALAREDLARTEQMVAQRLATRSRLAAARKVAADAEAALAAERRRGANRGSERVTAPFDGIVVSIAVAQGDRLAAGAPALQLARQTGLLVYLGIEPEDSDRVKAGMPVRLYSVFDARRTVDARVAQVHGMVNPQTQLVDVVVRLRDRELIPGMRVRGVITLSQTETWTVPRSAVLRDARGAYIFQVQRGRARRVDVRTGPETDQLTSVSGDFDPALPVVTLGNYELRDGMAVREAAR
jgi:membrane fusion protein, multidrug efflux system